MRQNFIGLVLSHGKMNKTVRVRVHKARYVRELQKYIAKQTDYLVHDEGNLARTGDVVRIQLTRPISPRKRFAIAEIRGGKGQEFTAYERLANTDRLENIYEPGQDQKEELELEAQEDEKNRNARRFWDELTFVDQVLRRVGFASLNPEQRAQRQDLVRQILTKNNWINDAQEVENVIHATQEAESGTVITEQESSEMLTRQLITPPKVELLSTQLRKSVEETKKTIIKLSDIVKDEDSYIRQFKNRDPIALPRHIRRNIIATRAKKLAQKAERGKLRQELEELHQDKIIQQRQQVRDIISNTGRLSLN